MALVYTEGHCCCWAMGDEPGYEPLEGRTRKRLIVGNIAFRVSERELREEIERIAPTRSVYIPRNAGGVSKGLAIVDFEGVDDAAKVKQQLDGTMLLSRRAYIRFDDDPGSRSFEPGRGPRRAPMDEGRRYVEDDRDRGRGRDYDRRDPWRDDYDRDDRDDRRRGYDDDYGRRERGYDRRRRDDDDRR